MAFLQALSGKFNIQTIDRFVKQQIFTIHQNKIILNVVHRFFRLHDYYRYNLSTFVNEGVIETDEIRAETSGELTVWDAFKIGVKGANSMLLGSGIDIMLQAFDKV